MKMNRDNKTIESRLPIVLAAAGFVFSLIAFMIYMRPPGVRTIVEALYFAPDLEICPATGLALILSSLAVVAAPRWKKIFWISVGGFVAAYVIALTTSGFFFVGGIYCCLVLIFVVVRRIRNTGWVAIVLIAGFAVEFILSQTMLESAPHPESSRTQADMRSLEIALDSYRVDYHAYPASTTDTARRLMWQSGSAMPSFMRSWPGGPCSLTTPVEYLSYMPVDPWVYQSEKRTFAYYCAPNGQKCVLIGAGPNCVFDIKPEVLDELTSNPLEFFGYFYDPTNGSVSAGDYFHVEPH